MTEHWIDRLSDYVDDDMAPRERRALEDHVAGCEACASALADLRRIVAMAGSLGGAPPETDLWPGIEARLGERRAVVVPIGADRERRRVSFSLPQLAAAVVAALLIGVSATWLALDGGGETAGPARVEAPGGQREARVVPVSEGPVEGSYAVAVEQLERELEARRDRLDPETLRAVETNLAVIDRAIEDIREALASNPEDPYLNRHLATTMQRKVDVLRQAAQAAI